MNLTYSDGIFNRIRSYLYDDKNSLIFLFGDRYSGKTELLQLLHDKDENNLKFYIEINDKSISLVRICLIETLIYLTN